MTSCRRPWRALRPYALAPFRLASTALVRLDSQNPSQSIVYIFISTGGLAWLPERKTRRRLSMWHGWPPLRLAPGQATQEMDRMIECAASISDAYQVEPEGGCARLSRGARSRTANADRQPSVMRPRRKTGGSRPNRRPCAGHAYYSESILSALASSLTSCRPPKRSIAARRYIESAGAAPFLM